MALLSDEQMITYEVMLPFILCVICKSILCQKEVCAMLQYIISLKLRKGLHSLSLSIYI